MENNKNFGKSKQAVALQQHLEVYEDCLMKDKNGNPLTTLPQKVRATHIKFNKALKQLKNIFLEVKQQTTDYETAKGRLETIRLLASALNDFYIKHNTQGISYSCEANLFQDDIKTQTQINYYNNRTEFDIRFKRYRIAIPVWKKFNPDNKRNLTITECLNLIKHIQNNSKRVMTIAMQSFCKEMAAYENSLKKS